MDIVIQTLVRFSRKITSGWCLTEYLYYNQVNISSEIFIWLVINPEKHIHIYKYPTWLEARLYVWNTIDHEHCDSNKLMEKAQHICTQFNKESNNSWTTAFSKIISIGKENQT